MGICEFLIPTHVLLLDQSFIGTGDDHRRATGGIVDEIVAFAIADIRRRRCTVQFVHGGNGVVPVAGERAAED